jgi:periplasmic divalent cation tolerance protein
VSIWCRASLPCIADNSHYPALEDALSELHPYELPEIVAVTLDDGSAGYLRWITTTLEEKIP